MHPDPTNGRPFWSARQAAVLGLLLASVAWAGALFVLVGTVMVPEGVSTFCDVNGCRSTPIRSRSLVDAHGPGTYVVVAAVLIAVLVVGAALVRLPGANPEQRTNRAALAWALSASLGVYSLFAAIGVGLFVLPPGLLLLAATAVATVQGTRAPRLRLAEVTYIAACAGLMAVALWDPNHVTGALVVLALVMTLPASALFLPVFYVVSALAWSASGADIGGPTWPVTLTYTVLIALEASANVAGLRLIRRRRARRRRQTWSS